MAQSVRPGVTDSMVLISHTNKTNPHAPDRPEQPEALARVIAGQWKKGAIPPKWDGKAAERIVLCFENMLGKRSGECDREDKTMTPDSFLSPQERGRRTEAG
jgi:hypothetical protein